MNTGPRSQVAILGIGTMGAGMARSLLREGFEPMLWSRNPMRLVPFAGTQARPSESVTEAVQHADIVITMVSDTDAVVRVCEDEGMLEALKTGAIWVQMSTIGVEGCDRVAALAELERPDIIFVDAPVSGSRVSAETGSLIIFASGPYVARRSLKSVFEAIGSRTLWVGPAGVGTRVKLVNNTMLAFVTQGLADALSVAEHLDVPMDTVIASFGGAGVASPFVSSKLSGIQHGEYDEQFSLSLARNDVNLTLDTVEPIRHPVLAVLAAHWPRA